MKILAALGLLTVAHAANAEVSGSIGLVSDYDYRGFSQTSNEPAVQLSIDYADESGWYIGTWGTNIDHFSDGGSRTATTEIDLYTGFSSTVGDLGWDVGLLHYMYPNASDLNFTEVYGKLSYGIVSGGVSYSNAFGHKDNDGAFYVFGDVSIPAGPLSIDLHAGMSTGDGIEDAYFSGFGEDSYQDYSIGLSYTANNITLGLKWVALDAGDAGSDDRFLVSISTSLPWGE